jgi:hypothetical protein
MASTNDTKPGDKPGDKPNDKPPAPPPFDVMAACTTIVNTLKNANADDQRRVLHSAATLLGIQTSRPAAPRSGNTSSTPQQQRGGNTR